MLTMGPEEEEEEELNSAKDLSIVGSLPWVWCSKSIDFQVDPST